MSQLSQAHRFEFFPARRAARGWICRLALAAILLFSSLPGGFLSGAATLAQEATPAVTGGDATYSRTAAASWLVDQQLPDGGFPGFSGESDPGTAVDAVTAAYALGFRMPPSLVLANARAYLLVHGPEYAAIGPGQAAKLALAAVALGDDPSAFGSEYPVPCDNMSGAGGEDLIALMTAPLATPVPNAIPGMYGDDLYDHALVLIALGAMYEAVPESALEPLRVTQGADGGWAFNGSTEPGGADSNTTALIIQALAETELWDNPIVPRMNRRGLEFLHSLLAPGGGFAFSQAEPLVADANSTALVVQALIAAGEDPASPEWGNAPQALARFQTDSGGFRYLLSDEEPNLLATVQAIPAMAGRPLPVAFLCIVD